MPYQYKDKQKQEQGMEGNKAKYGSGSRGEPHRGASQVSLIIQRLCAEENGFHREDLDDIMKLINYRAEESD
jgi:hypothetical protein